MQRVKHRNTPKLRLSFFEAGSAIERLDVSSRYSRQADARYANAAETSRTPDSGVQLVAECAHVRLFMMMSSPLVSL
jgi:hypothetical protein